MKYSLVSVVFALTVPYTFAADILKRHCDEIGGTVVNQFKCPKSKLPLKWNFCLSEDGLGRQLFFDGCTGPSGGHTELFYPACIKHDYCYHHEPSTNGYAQADCDRQFLANTLDLCVQAQDQTKCRRWAKSMYWGVRMFGKVAYHCADYEASYE